MHTLIHWTFTRWILRALLFAGAAGVQAAHIDFDDFATGTIIDDEYFTSLGVTINGVNLDRDAENLATVFNTLSPTGGDTDLASPFHSNTWGPINPGNVLILHEHPWECDGTSCLDPDDEGSKPAGYFDIVFSDSVTLNSVDFFDINPTDNPNAPGASIQLFDAMNTDIAPGMFNVHGTGGDNSWGRVEVGIAGVSSVRVHLGGSGAIDNINFTSSRQIGSGASAIPEPATPALALLALAGLSLSRRNRVSRQTIPLS